MSDPQHLECFVCGAPIAGDEELETGPAGWNDEFEVSFHRDCVSDE